MIRLILGSILIVAVVGCGGSSTSSGGMQARPSAGCGLGSLGAGTHAFEFLHDGRERFYEVHVPASYEDRTAVPLLLNLHPLVLGGPLHSIWTNESQHNVKAEESGFIVLQPDGTGSPTQRRSKGPCTQPRAQRQRLRCHRGMAVGPA